MLVPCRKDTTFPPLLNVSVPTISIRPVAISLPFADIVELLMHQSRVTHQVGSETDQLTDQGKLQSQRQMVLMTSKR